MKKVASGSIIWTLFSLLFGCQCDPNRVENGQPIVLPAKAPNIVQHWNEPPVAMADPTTKCADCHRDVVETYRSSKKYQTSRRVDAQLIEKVKGAQSEIEKLSVEHTTEDSLIIEEQIPYENRARRATASLSLGSGSKSFSALINGRQRLLPLAYLDQHHAFRRITGYRHEAPRAYSTQTAAACSGCHGLNDGKPSYHGVPCSGCHGSMQGHTGSDKAVQATPNHEKLKTFKGQKEICGNCHTHAKARFFRHDAEMRQRPLNHQKLFKDLVIYARDAYRDERAAGHGKHFAESKCFTASSHTIPLCSACHEPHSGAELTKRTRQTCQGCHQNHKPCLTAEGGLQDSDCAQCHFSHLSDEKKPHYNRLIHRIVRQQTTPTYWKSIQQRRLVQEFVPVRTQGTSEGALRSEKALISLEFARQRTKDKHAQSLRSARKQWPNTDATLALMRRALDVRNIPEAQLYRQEFEITQPLSQRAKLYWVKTFQSLDRHEDALRTLHSLKDTSNVVKMLMLRSHLRLKHLQESEALAKALSQTQLTNPRFLLSLAKLERLRGQDQAAEHWLQNLISLNPRMDEAYVLLANIHWARDAREKAIEVLSNGLVLNPHGLSILNLRGSYYEELGELPRASLDWEASLRVNRQQFDVYAKLFRLAIETGDRNSARLMLVKGQLHLPNDPRWAELTAILERRRSKK